MSQIRTRTTVPVLVLMAMLAVSIAAFARDTEEFHKTYPLNADGVFSISNVNGKVEIKGWDQNSVQVDAVKSANEREYLEATRIEVSASSSAVIIDTKYPEHMHNGNVSVEYTIKIPKDARIRKVDLVNGNLVIEGVRGDITASTVNGRVEVNGSAGDLRMESVNGQVSASVAQVGRNSKMNCVNGQVTLTLPSDLNADVHASTVSGNISNDYGAYVDHARYGPGTSMDAQIGSGGNRITISTVNGGIHLLRASDGKTASKVTQKGSKSSFY